MRRKEEQDNRPPTREHAHTVTLLTYDDASYLSGANVRIDGHWEGIDYCNREGIDYRTDNEGKDER